jgi:23S rRNA (uracil1939-C5)-methyltransferase
VTTKSLTIEKVVHGGMGLARTDSGAVLVPGVLPGEQVVAAGSGTKNGMRILRPVELLSTSPGRRSPPCGYFGSCGGCDWLFIDHRLQLQLKSAIFNEALERIGKLPPIDTTDTVAGPEFGYRRRAQIKINPSKVAGFFKRESNDVVGVSRCPLLTDRINGLLERCGADPDIIPDRVANLRVIDGDTALASQPVLSGFTVSSTTITCGTKAFEVAGDDFFQSNGPLLEPMAAWVAAHCRGSTVVDLYGGTGFFSVMLAEKFSKGILVETEPAMVRRAQDNFVRNGITTVRPVAAPAELMERHLPPAPDVMVVDPPRPGLTRNAREAVGRIGPKTLVYVSCNCATQARDAGYFVKKCGYAITASALVDLYPNTHHTETVMVMERCV